MKTLGIKFFGSLLLIAGLISYTPVMLKAETGDTNSTKSIVEIASSDARFSTLVEAVVKADLVDALSAEGPYTVFAPTNDAFAKLFSKLGVSGISDLSKDQLTPILLYHVLGSKVMSSDVKSGDVSTLNSEADLMVEAGDKGVKINKSSNVIIADLEAKNGVIHVIDAVLVPQAPKAAKSSGGCGN